MKLYAPKYYNKFKCIADKCSHSCCIGWEIDIDNYTLKKYNSISRGYADAIKNSISMEGTPHFRLCSGEKCPHLNQSGLCEIILNLGEDYLCDICREHPRFYNLTPYGREVGIGMACEEAARIILNSDDYGDFFAVSEFEDDEISMEFDYTFHRKQIFDILSDKNTPYNCRIEEIYTRYGISPKAYVDKHWRNLLAESEYLDENHKRLFSAYSSDASVTAECEKYLERALACFVYRHCGGASDEDEFFAALGFCLFCERLFASVISAENTKNEARIITLARIISEELEYSEDNTRKIMQCFG